MATVAELWRVLSTGLERYMRRAPLDNVVIGLSGGIDSAVVACLAVDALGPKRVEAITMPSRFTSIANLGDAMELASRLRIMVRNIPIGPPHPGVLDTPQTPFLETFEEGLKDCGYKVEGVTLENLQARLRAVILMAHANEKGALVLNTCNKSEDMVGYCTLYGDSIGAIAPLGNVLKTDVYKLAQYYNDEHRSWDAGPIPENIILKAPSAELRPDQKDTDELPPYEVLDPILLRYEEGLLAGWESLSDLERDIIVQIEQSKFKREQAPQALPAPRHVE